MKSAIIGKKIGMTSIFAPDGSKVACTVVEAGPCPVITIRTKERDGYEAIQLGYGNIKEQRVNKPLKGHFDKAGVPYKRHLKEFRDPETDYEVGQEITVNQFNQGDRVKVVGKSRGRGFQGVIKRHNFSGVGMQTHGQKDRERHPGSIGQSSYPSRVLKGTRMAGRMGGKRVTVRNIEVLEVIPDRNIILLKGSLPGSPNSIVEIVKL